jgi:hypothetical protein
MSPNISINSSNSTKYVLQFPLLLPFINLETEISLTLFLQERVDWILYNIAIYLTHWTNGRVKVFTVFAIVQESVPSYCLQAELQFIVTLMYFR